MKKNFYNIYKFVISIAVIWEYGKVFVDIFIGKNIAVFFDMASKGQSLNMLKDGAMLLLILLLCFSMFFFMNKTLGLKKQKCKEKLKIYVYQRFMATPYKSLEERSFGEIGNRLENDTDKFIKAFSDSFTVVISSTLAVITYFIYLAKINISLAGINLLIGILLIIAPILFKRKFNDYYVEYCDLWDEWSSCENESVDGYDFIKYNLKYDYFDKACDESLDKIGDLAYKLEKAGVLEGAIGDSFSNAGKFLLYGFISFFIFKERISLSDGIQWIVIGKHLIAHISKAFNQYKVFQNGFISLKRIEEVFKEDKDDKGVIIKTLDTISFEDVCFSYGDRPCVNKLNFTVNKGDKLIIEGSNGSGKSTIIKLLLGVYDVFEGNILINKTPILEVDKKSFRQRIAFVSQNQFFVFGSPEDNAKLFSNDYGKLNKFIDRFSLKEEELSKNSCNHLSGGQKQKISIIRALMKDSDLIIMDEPTNYLDANGISELNLEIANMEKTLIVITHDSSINCAFENQLLLDTMKEVG